MSSPHFTVSKIDPYTVIEFRTTSLMEPAVLEEIATELYRLVDEEDRRALILDFERVQYLSSQAIGIVINLHKRLSNPKLLKSKFILCSVGPKLQELVKITRLDRVLTIKPSQKEAVRVPISL